MITIKVGIVNAVFFQSSNVFLLVLIIEIKANEVSNKFFLHQICDKKFNCQKKKNKKKI